MANPIDAELVLGYHLVDNGLLAPRRTPGGFALRRRVEDPARSSVTVANEERKEFVELEPRCERELRAADPEVVEWRRREPSVALGRTRGTNPRACE